ncbi:TetR/AcrR family transcriptional regulator [Vibrio profundum]|uniref:TetR/AcrR family transcriptional regulator n=1 Tax=Vibrio profundum TaxID=2910247 RepID=UPI003D0F5960
MPWNPQHKLDTREKILTSAYNLFTRRGYDQVGINEVMAEADLTRGVFYKYFSSKSDLYSEALLQAASNSQGQLRANCTEGGGFLEEVRRYLSPSHREGEHANCPLAFLITDIVHRDEEIRNTYTEVFRRFTSTIPQSADLEPQTENNTTSERAIQSAVIMIGGLAISRAINDEVLAEKILLSCQQLLEAEALSS